MLLCRLDSGMAFCHTSSPTRFHRCPQKLTHNTPQPPRQWHRSQVPNPHLHPDLLLWPCSSSSATTFCQNISPRLPWAHCNMGALS